MYSLPTPIKGRRDEGSCINPHKIFQIFSKFPTVVSLNIGPHKIFQIFSNFPAVVSLDTETPQNFSDTFYFFSLFEHNGHRVTFSATILTMFTMIEKHQDIPNISLNLKHKEFRCKCTNEDCNFTLVYNPTVISFQLTRGKFGRPLKVNSGFRCQRHNEAVGGKKNSSHLRGAAIDLSCEYLEDLDLLEKIARDFFNVVIRYETFIHCHNHIGGFNGIRTDVGERIT